MHTLEYIKPLAANPSTAAMTRGMRLRRLLQLARELRDREHIRLRAEVLRIPELLTMLKKPCAGENWSAGDRKLLQAQLRGLGVVGLYMAMLLIPGTAVTLPLLAWWLDRRRRQRAVFSAGKSNKDTTPPMPPV